ncbi:MAG TPA: methyl-accepting chemotaxis protein, partial [Burkholderiaceae bacterium]|nr:methyl-accepting chemotaxis protein [Burkholderiaceae bacterium]
MRVNLPITNVETVVRDDQYLISKTDLKGRIIYANPAFIDVSGFTREELIGKAHNIVRHPEMPPQAYADLWQTLESGKPWLGVVKNRRKDGGFYWVLANVYGVYENGELSHYASVRVKASDEQIQAAEALYAAINENSSRAYTVQQGRRTRTTWRKVIDWVAAPFRSTLRAQLFRVTSLGVAAIILASVFAALGGVPQNIQWLVWPLIGIFTVGMLAYGWCLSQRILEAIENVAEASRQFAAGNLNYQLPDKREGDISRLNFYLDVMRKSLISIGDDVLEGVKTTRQTAHELAHNNTHLSARTEDQAASLQETAAAMEEITVTVQQNSDNAQLAAQLADESMQIAERGGHVVNDVVNTMENIQQGSREISDIVTLIEGIAFQTNILALNATVESARAGEAGKSFAVVAAEVRNLALRSSDAAKEVKALIDQSNARISTGSEQVALAGKTMAEIVDSVERVSAIMAEISTASSEQSTGILQINQAIGQMELVTQQNANLVHELGNTVNTLT